MHNCKTFAKSKRDDVFQQFKQSCQEGWPDKSQLKGPIKPYASVMIDISISGHTILRHVKDWQTLKRIRENGSELENLQRYGQWLPNIVGLHNNRLPS